MRTVRFYGRLARESPQALWHAASRGQVIFGSIILALAFLNRPAAKSLGDWEGASPWWGLILLGGLFLLGLLKANHEAFVQVEDAKADAERERDEAQRQLAAPSVDTPASRIDALVAEGDEIRARIAHDDRFPEAAWNPSYTDWDSQATKLLTVESPQHLIVYQGWREGSDPFHPLRPQAMRESLLGNLANRLAALRDISIRLRVAAGEAMEHDTARRARLKDILLVGQQRHEQLRLRLLDDSATKEEVVEWDRCFARLLRAALVQEEAEALVDTEDCDPSSYSIRSPLPEEERGKVMFDPEVTTVIAYRQTQMPDLQVRLGRADLRDDFDPRDWENLWT